MSMYKVAKTTFLVSSLCALCISTGTWAQSSASEAAAIATAKTGGKVLQVKQSKPGLYRVKVLMPNGQMRLIVVGKASRTQQ